MLFKKKNKTIEMNETLDSAVEQVCDADNRPANKSDYAVSIWDVLKTRWCDPDKENNCEECDHYKECSGMSTETPVYDGLDEEYPEIAEDERVENDEEAEDDRYYDNAFDEIMDKEEKISFAQHSGDAIEQGAVSDTLLLYMPVGDIETTEDRLDDANEDAAIVRNILEAYNMSGTEVVENAGKGYLTTKRNLVSGAGEWSLAGLEEFGYKVGKFCAMETVFSVAIDRIRTVGDTWKNTRHALLSSIARGMQEYLGPDVDIEGLNFIVHIYDIEA